MWYRFTPSLSETLVVSTSGSSFDTVLAVYTGTSIAALSPPLVRNDDLMTLQAQVSFAAEAGTTYYFRAGGFLGTMGTLKISVGLPPVNDDFANAIIIPPVLPYSTAQSTMSAAMEPGEPAPCGSISATVWYRITPSITRTITISTAGSGFDSCWSCGREQASIRSRLWTATETSSVPDPTLQITFVGEAGTTYHIQVGGYQGMTGALSLGVVCQYDADCDNTLDFTDNCPAAPNTGQENTDAGNTALNRPGADGLGDACDSDQDGDGFLDLDETAQSADPLVYCDTMRADVDGDGVVSILDLSRDAQKFGQSVPPAGDRLRQDADFVISILDLSKQASVFGQPVSGCP